MEVYQDLKEFIELLNENKVEYLIVGRIRFFFSFKTQIYKRYRDLGKSNENKC